MKLSVEYLNERHGYWRERIGNAGIWDSEKFGPVTIVIKKACRSYNAMFQRRVRRKNMVSEVSDKIIIYNKVDDFPADFLDSILVHEMIHQYIFQAGLKDTQTHGQLFRGLMHKINEAFKGELDINITDRNPALPTSGPGDMRHSLLIVYFEKDESFCAVIHPARLKYFDSLIKANKFRNKVINYTWAESNDVYFNQFRRCTRSFHGIKKSHGDMKEFCRQYNVRPI